MTKEEVIEDLRGNVNLFSEAAFPIFQERDWRWFHSGIGEKVPSLSEIIETANKLISDYEKSDYRAGYHSTGRIVITIHEFGNELDGELLLDII